MLISVVALAVPALALTAVQWPAPPAGRVASLESVIDLREARPETGFWSRIGRLVGGADEGERLAAPFDVVVVGEDVWMTCVETAGLVRMKRESLRYRVFTCEELEVGHPVSLASMGDRILMTDSARGVVYRTRDDRLEVWLDEGLERPTGIAVSASGDRVWVADTGVHQLVVFDEQGREVERIGRRGESDLGLNYPTFLATAAGGGVIINDTLNYRIKFYSAAGAPGVAFGEEGAGPGEFVRAKGVAQLEDGRILVVDGMLDRVQVFDAVGVPVLQIGAQGQAEGMFWSPAGIDAVGDLVYVADTYNNRIQVLRFEAQE